MTVRLAVHSTASLRQPWSGSHCLRSRRP